MTSCSRGGERLSSSDPFVKVKKLRPVLNRKESLTGRTILSWGSVKPQTLKKHLAGQNVQRLPHGSYSGGVNWDKTRLGVLMSLLLETKALIPVSRLKSLWHAHPQLAAYLITRHEIQVSAQCSNAIIGLFVEAI